MWAGPSRPPVVSFPDRAGDAVCSLDGCKCSGSACPPPPPPSGRDEKGCLSLPPTFLVQFSQFFLVFNSQLGHFLQLTIIP